MFTVFGAETDILSAGGGLDRMADAGTTWTRWSHLWWHSFEPTESVISEAALSVLDVQLAAA
jgi:hypothetical protein